MMVINISKLLLTYFVARLNFYLFKFYRYHHYHALHQKICIVY